MLKLEIEWDEQTQEVEFEHSLLSLSKWEENYKKPFMSSEGIGGMELLDYFGCMVVTPGVPPEIVYALKPEQSERLADYLKEERTASSVPDKATATGVRETITSELIYTWLTLARIPFQPTESWNLSRTLMLIRMVSFKQAPPEKQDDRKIMNDWKAENERRLALYETTG